LRERIHIAALFEQRAAHSRRKSNDLGSMRRAKARNNPVEPRNDILETFAAGVKPVDARGMQNALGEQSIQEGRARIAHLSFGAWSRGAEPARNPAASRRQ